MKKKTMTRIMNTVAAFLLVLLAIPPYFAQTPVVSTVSADNAAKPLDDTYIIDDLGLDVVSKFTASDGADPQLYSFSEFGYSINQVLREEAYGLYLYIYNPARTKYSERIGASVVNMATAYGTDGKPSSYENLPLKNCGYTTGKYDKLCYKFRIMGIDEVEKNATSGNTKDGTRRYDLAGIQLLEDGAKNAKDYSISTTYYCSGYAKGCGTGAENASTLTMTWEHFDTINLNVKHANYRTADYKDDVCDELNTVYFSVEERYFTEYGGLQKIKAEWYEYKTNPVFVTKDETAYTALKDYIGVNIGQVEDDLDYGVFWNIRQEGTEKVSYGHYNVAGKFTLGDYVDVYKGDSLFQMDWIFYRENASSRDDYRVSREEVEGYMTQYSDDFSDHSIRGKYAANLFSETIDEDRLSLLSDAGTTCGHIVREIDAGDTRDLMFKADQSWWSEFWHGVKYEEKGYSPIVVLTAEDISGLNADTFATEYLIGDTDKETVYSDVKSMIDEGKRAVLFRFAKTEYYASDAHFESWKNPFGSNLDGYVAQETVFIDFDIISLTFRKDGVDTVIAAVADPIDIINGFDPSEGISGEDNGGIDWLALLKKIIAAIVVIAVLYFVFKLIFKGKNKK